MSSTRRLTLRDIAKQAGVSYQTVSRVINNHPYVAEETRQRIHDLIAELDYHPNKAARSLATRRSHTLALITFGMDYYGPAQMVIHIERAAKAAGYDLVLSIAGDISRGSVQDAIASIMHWQVDGILMIKPVPGVAYDDAIDISGGVPTVQINGEKDDRIPSISVEQAVGSRIITEHLLELGHQHICEISGPLNWYDALERHESWQQTMRAAGYEPGYSIEGDWTAQGGYRAMQKLLSITRDFTAVVVANDQMALGALRALRMEGIRVPEDVSVVGFDDVPEAACYEPPLTTVRQEFDVLGQQGIEYLVERINNPDAPIERHIIYPALIKRLSSAPPRRL